MKMNSELYNDVMRKLDFEPAVDATNITVAVHEGIVTLGGSVGTYTEKRIAERAVCSLDGVKAVANELTVTLLQIYQRSDVDIAKTAVDSLAWTLFVPHEKIKVSVEHGWITLMGEVNWQFEIKNAEKAVRNLRGVKGITNKITVKSQILAQDVKAKIMSEFERNAEIDAKNISVEIVGSKVILRGNVHSWREVQEAKHAAWSISGVTEVENFLMITY